MNDRVSQKPPSVYTREEEAMDRYMKTVGATSQSQSRGIDMHDTDTFYDAGISSSKHSGMFRFGKAIANAFNPANVWHGINGIWKETEESKPPEKNVLQERQAKAEKAYAELKKSGFKGTKTPSIGRTGEDLPTIRYEDVAEVPQEATFRDSGVDMDGYRSSTERSKDNLVIAPVKGLMPPPPIPGSGRSPSPTGAMSSGRRSSLSLHKPSFQNLKKVKSHFHLSPTKRAQSEISLPLPSIEIDALASTPVTAQTLRNSPSKKDLVKQQKLTKRVSDLETKLEKARRELDGLEQPSTLGLKPFKPGALPSLPSQRVLNSHGSSNDPEKDEARVYPKRNSTNRLGPDDDHDVAPKVNSQLEDELKTSVSRNSLSRKRKSGDDLYRPSHEEDREDSDFDPAKKDMPKKVSVRSRKSQKIENDVATKPTKAKGGRNMTPNGPRRIFSQKALDPVPPLPAKSKVFDVTKIDQAKILSMRSVPNKKFPFGKLAVDIFNLRVLYPDMTEAQLAAYIDNLPTNKKKTDHRSVSHQDRPASPFLAPPLCASPPKIQARKSKRGISPPPPSLISPKRPAIKVDVTEKEDTATVNSEGEDTVAPLPESLSRSKDNVAKAAVKHVDKPLPGIQKEDFEWPEDVF